MLQSERSAPVQRRAPREAHPGELQIVNPDPRYGKIRLIEPTTLGYIHVAAAINPRRFPFLPTGRKKSVLLNRLKWMAQELERLDVIEKVTIFDALALPPIRRLPYIRDHADALHLARFDLVVLIETRSPAAVHDVMVTPAYQALIGALASQAKDLHVMTGRNAKRVGDVDKTRGVFLFNYFVADDREVMLKLWDYLADWYAVETGLDNSILLVPLEDAPSDYLAINHARWDESLLDVFRSQLSKPSFWTYLQANLEANRVGAMPILYRLADRAPRSARRVLPWVLAASAAAAALGAGLTLRRLRHA